MAQKPHDRLREARSKAGYATAAAFAKAYDLPESTYRSHENGSRGLNVAAARHYGELLGLPWLWIMEGEIPSAPGETRDEESETPAPEPRPAPPTPRPRIDIEVLAAILERIEANLARRRRKMTPLHKAELVSYSYALVEELGLEAATRELRAGLRARAPAKSA